MRRVAKPAGLLPISLVNDIDLKHPYDYVRQTVMRGRRPVDLSESTKQKIPQVLGAFVAGLVIVLGGALIYWNLQQNRVSVQAVNVALSKRSSSSATHPRMANDPVSVQPSENTAPNRELDSPAVKPSQPVDIAPVRARSSSSDSALDAYAVVQQSGPGPAVPPPSPSAPVAESQYAPVQRATSKQPLHTSPPPDDRSPESVPLPSREVVTIQPGTVLTVRLAENLSSDTSRPGDTFRAALAAPLVVNGLLVARTDSVVLGRVTEARKSPLIRGRSELSLTLTDIATADGSLVRIVTNNVEQKGSHRGLVNTAEAATGAAVGAVVGAVTGAAEGAGISSGARSTNKANGFIANKRATVFPAGTQVTFDLAGPITVSLRSDRH